MLNPKKAMKIKTFILDMVRAVGSVLFQVHDRVWLTDSAKTPRLILSKELGWKKGVLVWPSMVVQRGSTGGSEGAQKDPIGTKGDTKTGIERKKKKQDLHEHHRSSVGGGNLGSIAFILGKKRSKGTALSF